MPSSAVGLCMKTWDFWVVLQCESKVFLFLDSFIAIQEIKIKHCTMCCGEFSGFCQILVCLEILLWTFCCVVDVHMHV